MSTVYFECFLCVSHCSRSFTWIISFDTYNLQLSPVSRWEQRDTSWLNDLPKVIWNKGSSFLNLRLMNVEFNYSFSKLFLSTTSCPQTVLWSEIVTQDRPDPCLIELTVKGLVIASACHEELPNSLQKLIPPLIITVTSYICVTFEIQECVYGH